MSDARARAAGTHKGDARTGLRPARATWGGEASAASKGDRPRQPGNKGETKSESNAPNPALGPSSPFMAYRLKADLPNAEDYGPRARMEMPYTDVLDYWYGKSNYQFVDMDVPALRRDEWPSITAARSPHTMFQPRWAPLDGAVMATDRPGTAALFTDIKQVIAELGDRWLELGLPTTEDKWRGTHKPDTATLAQMMVAQPRGAMTRTVSSNYAEVCQLVASIDNLSKFTVQRYVPPCWYMQNMAANHVTMTPVMRRAVGLLRTVAKRLLTSEQGRELVRTVTAELSDPFGTAVGWPIFASSVDLTDGMRDDAKMAILSQFDGAFKGINWRDEASCHAEMTARLKARVPSGPLSDFPLAYLVNRRARVGGKANPDWGMRDTAVLEKLVTGGPYARIAQAAPWLGNLIQGTVFPYFKALRIMLTGCYHTSALVSEYMGQLQGGNKFLVESDISQYDLNFAIEITDAIDDVIAERTTKPKLAKSILHAIRRTPILMPDPTNMGGQSRGIMITADIMMPSGIKLTAEYGTLGNVLVCMCHQLESGMRDAEIVAYWDASRNNRHARWLMQGDDKVVIGDSLPSIIKAINEEAALYPLIGVTGKVEIGDRFLQKHLFGGGKMPVAGRIVQQRLQNEHPFDSYEQMMVGLTASTAGLFGYDPLIGRSENAGYKLGFRPGPAAETVQRTVLGIVKRSFDRAPAPYPAAIDFINMLLSQNPDTKALLRAHEKAAQNLIRKMGLDAEETDPSVVSRMLIYYDRNKYSAAVADFFAELTANSPAWAGITAEFEGKKIAFSEMAYDVIGLPRNLMS